MPLPTPSLTNPLGQGGTLASANAGVPFIPDDAELITDLPSYPFDQTRGQVTDGLGFARRGVDPFIHASGDTDDRH